MRQNRATIVVGIAVAAILAAALAFAAPGAAGGQLEAHIHDADGTVHVVDLRQDATIQVSTQLGSNTVAVEGGAVRIAEADCPHGDCMRQLPISQPGQQLICLPHRLWVEIVPAGQPSSNMDVSAVQADGDSTGVDVVAR